MTVAIMKHLWEQEYKHPEKEKINEKILEKACKFGRNDARNGQTQRKER